jgi:hypothetical protein
MIKKFVSLVIALAIGFASVSNASAAGGSTKVIDSSKQVLLADGKTYTVVIWHAGQSAPKAAGSRDAILAAPGCGRFEYGVSMYNYFGWELWRYSQTINWCWNGSTITSVSHSHNPAIYVPGWSYNGLVSDHHSGGVGSTSFWANSRADMCLVNYGGGCLQHTYPWADQWVYGNGGANGTAGY